MAGEPQRMVPLAPLTTWKIGGPAEWFALPEDESQLMDALGWARSRQLPVTVLGRGSNVLIADEGIRGLVICLRGYARGEIRIEPTLAGEAVLEVSAGLSLPRLSKVVAQHGYGGYEFYIGIPGTVGGAVVMNAGYGPGDARQTASLCREVRAIHLDGEGEWRPYRDFHPVYRHTDLVGSDRIVTAARFSLKDKSTREQIRAETARHLAMRKEKQPLTRPTAGSVFKGTPEGVPAAVYIDRCGLKGLTVGGAMVSPKHANWIENTGSATSRDVVELMERVRALVLEKEGVELEAEVRYLQDP
ncbi:MAG: UDP-N-acetylmuramate dehydrogenase [Oceanipulchritudo sp.]